MTLFSKPIVAGALLIAANIAPAAVVPTGVTGSSTPFSQYQPGLVLTQLLATTGVFPSPESGGGTEVLGEIRTFAGNYGAFGAPQAQGQVLPISSDITIFSLLGTNYGGNGITNFALPNLAGKTIVGSGQGPRLSNYMVGQQAGSATTVLTEANLPPHDHTLPGGGITSVVGSATPFDNREPTLAMTSIIAASGVFPSHSGTPNAFLGEIDQFAGNFAPAGFLQAAGQLLPISQYIALFSVLGTTYGGDGVTTFALPDLRGRTVVGVGTGPGLAAVTLGQAFGGESTTLTLATMPAHDHTLAGGGVTGTVGGGLPYDTRQPSLGLTYLIATQGIFPPQDSGSIPFDTPYLGEVQAFAGNFAPGGWALADGQLLSIASNIALFSILGTTYGGNGITNFALPDLRGRSVLGAGGNYLAGDQVGSDSTTLTIANLSSHDHLTTVADVPEPASWAMMVAGFALVGTASRRRQRIAVTR